MWTWCYLLLLFMVVVMAQPNDDEEYVLPHETPNPQREEKEDPQCAVCRFLGRRLQELLPLSVALSEMNTVKASDGSSQVVAKHFLDTERSVAAVVIEILKGAASDHYYNAERERVVKATKERVQGLLRRLRNEGGDDASPRTSWENDDGPQNDEPLNGHELSIQEAQEAMHSPEERRFLVEERLRTRGFERAETTLLEDVTNEVFVSPLEHFLHDTKRDEDHKKSQQQHPSVESHRLDFLRAVVAFVETVDGGLRAPSDFLPNHLCVLELNLCPEDENAMQQEIALHEAGLGQWDIPEPIVQPIGDSGIQEIHLGEDTKADVAIINQRREAKTRQAKIRARMFVENFVVNLRQRTLIFAQRANLKAYRDQLLDGSSRDEL